MEIRRFAPLWARRCAPLTTRSVTRSARKKALTEIRTRLSAPSAWHRHNIGKTSARHRRETRRYAAPTRLRTHFARIIFQVVRFLLHVAELGKHNVDIIILPTPEFIRVLSIPRREIYFVLSSRLAAFP